MGLFRNKEKLALKELNGKPLITYTIEEALNTSLINRVIVSTEDREIAEVSLNSGAEVPFLRPIELARTSVPFEDVLKDLINTFRVNNEDIPDVIVVLPYFTPFRKESHITEAIDTILLYNSDSVIGVVTDLTFHWKPGKYGLTPVGYKKRFLREDKETVYKESGAIYVIKTSNLDSGTYFGNVIGHTELSTQEAWRIENNFDFWIAQKISSDTNI